MDLIRIRMDQELLPVSGSVSVSGTRKIQSWIQILNKSFRIRNIALQTHAQLLTLASQLS